MPPKRMASSRGTKLKTPAVTASLAELVAGKDASTKKFGKASAMTEKYEQQLQQGYRWLKELLEVESRGTDLPAGCPNLLDCQQSWHSEDLKHAFDKIPTSASLWVLALFIS
ncbi:hypothetical protein K439DRAFT_1624483 [Ramaria rubella]|nr:hypothetical protein K439DRAFT_1624483 [Ramaria rubella]